MLSARIVPPPIASQRTSLRARRGAVPVTKRSSMLILQPSTPRPSRSIVGTTIYRSCSTSGRHGAALAGPWLRCSSRRPASSNLMSGSSSLTRMKSRASPRSWASRAFRPSSYSEAVASWRRPQGQWMRGGSLPGCARSLPRQPDRAASTDHELRLGVMPRLENFLRHNGRPDHVVGP
jgi:hypothetical protein